MSLSKLSDTGKNCKRKVNVKTKSLDLQKMKKVFMLFWRPIGKTSCFLFLNVMASPKKIEHIYFMTAG